MLTILYGIFLILHGIVFYLYAGQSARLFELKPGMTWPNGSWAFSKYWGDDITRKIGLISCLLSGTGFIVGGTALLFIGEMWKPIVFTSAAFSSILIILLWNGSIHKLSEHGFVGVLINLGILLVLLFLKN